MKVIVKYFFLAVILLLRVILGLSKYVPPQVGVLHSGKYGVCVVCFIVFFSLSLVVGYECRICVTGCSLFGTTS
jgi:hypothetical protein